MITHTLGALAGKPHSSAAYTPWWQSLWISVASGILVALILTIARSLWTRRRIPTALSRKVRRKTYLDAVLAESRRPNVVALDVLAPRLTPATDDRMKNIQKAWTEIDARAGGHVRVLILDDEQALKGGAQLLSAGIKVRVARRELGRDDLSFHLFESDDQHRAIVNHHDEDGSNKRIDKPVLLTGSAPTQPFRECFQRLWKVARPIEAVIADKIIEKTGGPSAPLALLQTLDYARHTLRLEQSCIDKVLLHLAFRNSSSVILITGLPGAGKSTVRRLLGRKLDDMGIRSREFTDYVYAFRDHLHGLIKLQPARGVGFEACEGGAFAVSDERALEPALEALARAVAGSLSDSEVILAEFARADIIPALDQFGDISHRCRVLYVEAPLELRSARLRNRREPPESSVDGTAVILKPSDNHILPSFAERNLYTTDSIDELMMSSRWRGRVSRIENDVNDGGGKIAHGLQQFMDDVISRYRTPASADLKEELVTSGY